MERRGVRKEASRDKTVRFQHLPDSGRQRQRGAVEPGGGGLPFQTH